MFAYTPYIYLLLITFLCHFPIIHISASHIFHWLYFCLIIFIYFCLSYFCRLYSSVTPVSITYISHLEHSRHISHSVALNSSAYSYDCNPVSDFSTLFHHLYSVSSDWPLSHSDSFFSFSLFCCSQFKRL